VIECVPNTSEGKDLSFLDRAADALTASGCSVLDRHIDPDHHRSVLTYVGEEGALFAGALALVRLAVARIDLRVHQGVHPRIGAVDVLPFVPMHGASIADCVRLARRVGEAIAERFSIPVFLYGAAATRAARRDLAAVRRGQFEGLAEKLTDPEWTPDYGPQCPHPTAGAVAVGARGVLVAYNVLLETNELEIARRVARALRASDGGLPGVRAMGFPIGSRRRVQVSMNLTDPSRVGLATAFERVVAEAAKFGVRVAESEIVGLVPRAASEGATAERLQLARPLEDAVLENHGVTP